MTYFLHICTALGLVGTALAADESVRVGAIRWDAWYGETGPVKHVEHSLGQPKYHFRLPWFASIGAEGKVSIDGDSEATMQAELNYAAAAGLDYWAFLDYGPGSPMTRALDRYLAAQDKRGMSYCFVEEGGQIDARGAEDWLRVIEHFKSPHYVKVLDERPLLFVFERPKKHGREIFDDLRRRTGAAGMKEPYLVLMGWNANEHRAAFGFDAISEYACAGKGYTSDPESYERLTSHHVKEKLWDKWERERSPCITFATAGWDTRPRQERPPPWCTWVTASPDPTPPAQQKPLIDSATASPDQLAAHLRDAIAWTQAHRDLNPTKCLIVYGWNENDEGGWLIPTLSPNGEPDISRIQAIGRVLWAR